MELASAPPALPPLSRGDHNGTLPPSCRGRQPSALTAGVRANGLRRKPERTVRDRGMEGAASSPPAWLISSDDNSTAEEVPRDMLPSHHGRFPAPVAAFARMRASRARILANAATGARVWVFALAFAAVLTAPVVAQAPQAQAATLPLNT